MSGSLYEIRDIEGLEQFNTGRGSEIVYGRSPEVVYHLPGTKAGVYSHELSLGDLIHPFRPSGEFVVEFLDGNRRKFFSGTEEGFSSLDSDLMERIERADSSEFYKEIKSQSTIGFPQGV